MSIDRRMLMRGAIACACCFKAGAAIASDAPAHGGAAAHWSYEGEGSPEKWGELQSDFKVCQLGLEQTPIDLGSGIKGDVGSVDYDYKPLLAGKNFDLECHFVHKASTGALAVTGVFIRPGAANAALKAFFESMPAKEGPEVRGGNTIDVGAVLPKSGGYFRYMGSLTTPPCSEGLTWTVHKEPIEASVEQIQKFAALFPKNARPVQKRNRRFLIDAS